MSASRRRRRLVVAVSTVVLVSLAAACGGDKGGSAVAIPNVYDLRHDPAADVAPISADRADVLAADQLRSVLERQLAWHGVTLVESMRAARRDDPQVAAWIDALAGNTDQLVAAIGLVYGPDGARAFNQQWAQHTQFLLDYAVAIRDGDERAAEAARANLATYAADSGGFFETATGGALPADTVEQLLSTHIAHMYAMIDADADGATYTTLTAALDDNAYLLGIADGIATAIASQQPTVFPGAVDTVASRFGTAATGTTAGYLLTQFVDGDQAAVAAAAEDLDSDVGHDHAAMILGDRAPLAGGDLSAAAAAAQAVLDRALAITLGSN